MHQFVKDTIINGTILSHCTSSLYDITILDNTPGIHLCMFKYGIIYAGNAPRGMKNVSGEE